METLLDGEREVLLTVMGRVMSRWSNEVYAAATWMEGLEDRVPPYVEAALRRGAAQEQPEEMAFETAVVLKALSLLVGRYSRSTDRHYPKD